MKQRVIDFLMGKQPQTAEVNPTSTYGADVDNFINALREQPYMQKLYNAPIQERLSDEQIAEKVANGLNLGIPELAQAQKDVGIRIPQGTEQVAQAQLAQKQASTPLTLGDRFFGREMTQDYQTINPDTNETEMTTISNYRPGFFNDLASGYRENATQGFDVNNLAPQRKGLATRIGEGLGTLARFYDKPIGRMAVATGLSMLTDEANPLGEGVKAYVGRQQYQTADKVYRNQLKQLGMTDEELNAIKGNITKDIFEGVTSGMRLGNQRMTYGQLAMLDEEIAREVAANPALANQFVPVNFARDIYGKKRDTAEGKMAQIAAEVAKTKKETDLLGKPKPKTTIEYVTKSEGGGSDRLTQTDDAGVVRVQAPNGQTGTIPRARLREAIKAGYKVI